MRKVAGPGRSLTRGAIRAEVAAAFPRLAARLNRSASTGSFDPEAIVLGRGERDQPISLSVRPRLEHTHVIGTTGGGKTTFMEHCIRQDIALGRGVCVVDPHGDHPGSLYGSLLSWLDRRGLTSSRVIHLIDPNAPDFTVGFNPLARPDAATDLSVIAGTTLEAFERVWGEEDTHSKPTIRRVLLATFTALAECGLTLAEADLLFDPHDRNGIRAYVVRTVDDHYARSVFGELHQLAVDDRSKRDFRAEVIGPINRIAEFVRASGVRNILGQSEHTIDLGAALDDGHIILANLSGGSRVYEADAELLGRLLVRFLFFHAKRRRHPERAFFVYLDECQRYLSGDVETILAELRKYGVGLIAAHQWLAQLGEPDDPIRQAVLNGTNLKAVFRIKSPAEAEELAGAVIPLNLEMPVRVLDKPTVVGNRRTQFRSTGTARHRARSHGVAETVAESESTSTGESDASHTSESVSESLGEASAAFSATAAMSSTTSGQANGMVLSPDVPLFGAPETLSTSVGESIADTAGTSRSDGAMTSDSHSWSSGSTKGSSHATSSMRSSGWSRSTAVIEAEMEGTSESDGMTEGLEPIFEVLPTAVHSRDNMLYMAAQALRSLKTGQGCISYVGALGMHSTLLNVPRVTSEPLDQEDFQTLRSRILEASPSSCRAGEAAVQVADRRRLLVAAAQSEAEADDEPESFRVAAERRSSASKG